MAEGLSMIEVAKLAARFNLLRDGHVVPVILSSGEESGKSVIQAIPEFDQDSKYAAICAAIVNARRISRSNHVVLVIDCLLAYRTELEEGPSLQEDPAAVDVILVIEAKAGKILTSSVLRYGKDDAGEIIFPEGWHEYRADAELQGGMQWWLEGLTVLDDLDEGIGLMYAAYPDIDDLALELMPQEPRLN